MEQRVKFLVLALLLPALFISCTKSGALTGSSSGGGSGNTLNGSVSGGLSPISGAQISLFVAGNATAIANATTTSSGAFTIAYTNPGSGLLYLKVSGGNAGSGANSAIQLMSIVGPAATAPASVLVNEGTTAAASIVSFNMGIFNDSNGAVTLNAPNNAAGAGNILTQTNNLITSSGTTVVNPTNSNVTTSMTNALYTMANALASCIENSSKCTSLFNAAQSTTGAAALNLMDAANNMLNNSSNTASPVYTIAYPLSTSTGFPLSSSSLPGGFTFNNVLPASSFTANVGNTPLSVATDNSGNGWIVNQNDSTVSKISPTGALLGTFTIPGSRGSKLAIDASGNVWVGSLDIGKVTVFNPAGAVIGQFGPGGSFFTQGASIDASGNVWLPDGRLSPNGSVAKLNSSGTVLGTVSGLPINNPQEILIDSSGNAWVINAGDNNFIQISPALTITRTFSLNNNRTLMTIDSSGNLWLPSSSPNTLNEFSSGGGFITSFSISRSANDIGIDPAGNFWITSGNLLEVSPSGVSMAFYSTPTGVTRGLSIDISGNIWIVNLTLNTVTVYQGLTTGPQFFPYTGPQHPDGTT